MEKKNNKNKPKPTFKSGDLIFSKFGKSKLHWPAKVLKGADAKGRYEIEFFGDKKRQFLSVNNLFKFDATSRAKYCTASNLKRTNYKNAVDEIDAEFKHRFVQDEKIDKNKENVQNEKIAEFPKNLISNELKEDLHEKAKKSDDLVHKELNGDVHEKADISDNLVNNEFEEIEMLCEEVDETAEHTVQNNEEIDAAKNYEQTDMQQAGEDSAEKMINDEPMSLSHADQTVQHPASIPNEEDVDMTPSNTTSLVHSFEATLSEKAPTQWKYRSPTTPSSKFTETQLELKVFALATRNRLKECKETMDFGEVLRYLNKFLSKTVPATTPFMLLKFRSVVQILEELRNFEASKEIGLEDVENIRHKAEEILEALKNSYGAPSVEEFIEIFKDKSNDFDMQTKGLSEIEKFVAASQEELEDAISIEDEITAENNKSVQSHANSSLLSSGSTDPLEVLKNVRNYLASAQERFSSSDDESDSSFERVITSASASDSEDINSQDTDYEEEPSALINSTNVSASITIESDSEMSE